MSMLAALQDRTILAREGLHHKWTTPEWTRPHRYQCSRINDRLVEVKAPHVQVKEGGINDFEIVVEGKVRKRVHCLIEEACLEAEVLTQ